MSQLEKDLQKNQNNLSGMVNGAGFKQYVYWETRVSFRLSEINHKCNLIKFFNVHTQHSRWWFINLDAGK